MFERFTGDARRVVFLAQEEARALGHGRCGPEHLLLGLIGVGDGLAILVLGIEPARAREQVARLGMRSAHPPRHVPYAEHTQVILTRSLFEALRRGHSQAGTEHLLLGLLDGSEVVAKLLTRLGADPGGLRERLQLVLAGNVAQKAGADPAAGAAVEGVHMFERFTDRARRVVVLAQEEAR
ncbi:Clp protease N-terminal domain-containing protein, partial [Amycolatopsis sp. NPDC005003]